jgi:hypothetical protein
MKLLHDSGQQHEEFRLRLAKDRDVELASINVQKEIAQAHSSLVGEALRSAKIDIVGGENDFFEKVVRAVGNGKAVDRLVGNSGTLTDIKNTFFNGDGDYFKAQLKQWIDDFGISTEDVKNLTIAALLGRMIAGTKDASLKGVMESSLAMLQQRGLANAPAASIVTKPTTARG